MHLLLALILAQAPVEERIEAFIKGDAAARESLLKLGPFGIRPLQKARDQSPDKIEALIFDLKKVAAYPKDSPVAEKLAEKGEFMFGKVHYQEALSRLSQGRFSIVYDDVAPKSETITVELSERTAREALDYVCRETGLDYGLFHNLLLISSSERLWPEGKKAVRSFGPPAVDRQHNTPEDQAAARNLKSMKVNVDFQNMDVGTMAMYLKEFSACPVKVEGDPDKKGLTVRTKKEQSAYDILCIITQLRGLDFMFREGGVVIDTREAIEKKIAGKK